MSSPSPWRGRLVCALQLAAPLLSAAAGLTPSLQLQPRHDGPSSSCKAVPGTPGWPSPQDWARFNESLAGRLLQPPPPGAVCHSGQASYNATECPAVRTAWSTYEFHAADPISVDWNQWANDSCLPQEGAPCSRQGYPVFVVNASEARHVQLAVQFARKHNVRLVVKSSGHDYMGRSNAPNSLSIWTHNLRGLQTHNSFRPSRCNVTIEGTAVTAGPGTSMWELYSALDALNQTVVGGGGKTVSLGGYLTGAGHGLLSPWYGLAADQVLEMEVVTPTGEIVTANECQNEDLFWAMRGGGGSTFGVMTSVTMKTFPTPRLETVDLIILTTNVSDPRPVLDMIAYVLSNFPSFGDQGLSGYSYFSPAITDPDLGGNTTIGGFIMSAALRDSSPEAMSRLWDPVLAHINATWPGLFRAIPRPASYPSFLAWYRDHYDQSTAGADIYLGSRLLDKAALTADPAKTAAALQRWCNGSVAEAFLVSGKGVFDARPRGGGNAVLPAWRKSYVHAPFGAEAPPLDPAAALAVLEQINTRVQALRELAPDTGAYAYVDEPDWQHAFWGSNYPRLARIKRALDPDDVLWCTPCVGNERWRQVGDRLCRVSGHQH
ncbi:17c0ff80-6478-469b-8018-7a82ef6159b7 [Thermothielavioides terrestris]|uniref:17c0ff80-6478-469b-8018-7a82ef6159b7 n=1 Tax=Thermothielavioides terrestris TaxID=2587410 RepID=A0A446BAJ9_9PEZI|nr:17c0ff80-6478-469b-8018-7a82ef6159b7 [Thermothielavioides terrestris]